MNGYHQKPNMTLPIDEEDEKMTKESIQEFFHEARQHFELNFESLRECFEKRIFPDLRPSNLWNRCFLNFLIHYGSDVRLQKAVLKYFGRDKNGNIIK